MNELFEYTTALDGLRFTPEQKTRLAARLPPARPPAAVPAALWVGRHSLPPAWPPR